MERKQQGLADHRRDQGLSIRKLADMAEVSSRTIVRIEGGYDAFPSTMKRVADALGIEPLDIREFAHQRERERSSETATQG